MSLLVLNSSSKVAQGVIRHLQKSGKFDSINCADLYPNYWGVQSQVNFLHSLRSDKANTSKTTLVDTHIQDRPDLERAFAKATHVVYVTHDYYTNVAGKSNVLINATKIAANQKQLQSFVALTPNELDHYGEQDLSVAARSESEAQKIYNKLVHIRSDLTFGKDSSVTSLLINKLNDNDSLTFIPSTQGPAPIHTNCLAHGVETALQGKHEGKVFSAEGGKRLSWNDVISVLSQATQSHPQLNQSNLDKIASPLSNNILSEAIHRDTYRNAVQYINRYTPIKLDNASPITDLGVKPIDFESHYKASSIKRSDSSDRLDATEVNIKQFIY